MIRLKIITNRKICKIPLDQQIERIVEERFLKGFVVDSIVLREKDLGQEEYEELFLKLSKIANYYDIDLYAHKNWNSKVCMGGGKIHLSYPSFKNIVSCKLNRDKLFANYSEIGISVHSIEEALMAEIWGASYVTYGHIFRTDCKKGLEPRGMDKLRELCLAVDIPVYAIGGINSENAKELERCGVYGVCMMSGVMKL